MHSKLAEIRQKLIRGFEVHPAQAGFLIGLLILRTKSLNSKNLVTTVRADER